MELSQDENIFKLIKELEKRIKNNEVIINFNNNSDWTENEFNNFINVMRNNYTEKIDEECLEVSNANNFLIINKINSIINYCNTNTNTPTNSYWESRDIIKSEKIDNLFDVNLECNIINKNKIESIQDFDKLNKNFKFIKKFNYDLKNGIVASALLIKTLPLNKSYTSLKESKVLISKQRYEFEIKITDTKDLLSVIIIVIKSLFMSNIILTKKQQKEILDNYNTLVRKDIQVPEYNKDIILINPKPVTLEQKNLSNPDDYGAISILRNYTVTEKADGERILMYIDNKGNIFLINSSLKVEETGIKANKEAYNSLIDGEYIVCNKRTDRIKKNLYAAFDIYYLNGISLTSLPLIDEKNNDKSRYGNLLKTFDYLNVSNSEIEYIIKKHLYTNDIINDCNKILDNPKNFPYEIDGLIFTPAKLALFSYYPTLIGAITLSQGWDRVFKWKPPEQNTIDFLIRFSGDVRKQGIRYKKIGLYVGYNPLTTKDLTIEEGLKLRYDKNYSKEQYLKNKEMSKKKDDFIPILFKPIVYYHADIEYAFLRIDSNGDIRAENNDKIETDTIVEFRYNIEKKEWIPIRIREDKTRIYKKGIFSKTANSLPVAINVWRSIHNPISKELITGNAEIKLKDNIEDIEGKALEADDIYYSRGIPRRSLLSFNMITFHNIGINEMLYLKSKNRDTLLELACGQASDLSRWINAGYKFVLGLDLAKDNIYKANDGAYARVLREYGKFNKMRGQEKGYFLNAIFGVADCSKEIRSGEAAIDKESKELIKIIMNKYNKNLKNHYKYIAGKGADGFDCITCMFAIHYFFKSNEILDGFLNNVSSNLKKNGIFICTFMDGESVINALNETETGIIEGRKILDGISYPLWAIIKRYTNEHENYSKKIDIFIENTQKLIPEYLVNFNFLCIKAKEYGLEINETELYSTSFNKLKEKIAENEEEHTSLDKIILELDKDEIQKRFSSFNRWAIFKKIV